MPVFSRSLAGNFSELCGRILADVLEIPLVRLLDSESA